MTAKVKKELRGRARSADGSKVEVHAIIYSPNQERGTLTWTCSVHCPFLFERDKNIAGIDANQAVELAEAFLDDLFEHHGVTVIEHP